MASATLFLAGDVMTGRAIDQILPDPGDPAIFERYMSSARDYVALAEKAHGVIKTPVNFRYVWGDAPEELERHKPDARIVNLETAVTGSNAPEPKGINYKMSPANIPVLTAAGVTCCALANNHVLDWGQSGLLETLSTLKSAGILTSGAGSTLDEACRPAAIELRPDCRICVYSVGSTTSGIPHDWAAGPHHAGICLLPDLSKRTAIRLAEAVKSKKQPGDVIVISVHWGPNWGYGIPHEQRLFAHTLIELEACDVLHGHSSHHARGIEIYRDRLILYGCGDFITDYEGIGGREEYRGDLSVMYLPRIDTESGALMALTLAVFQMHRLRLRRASSDDIKWLQALLTRESEHFRTRFALSGKDLLKAQRT
jgi:poly-gamma-glutamate synthesis protein (capsule biosynthesis protein)